MCAEKQTKNGKRLTLYVCAALVAAVVLGASLGLMGFIDHKLKQGAEQQVVTFTQQAAGNVSDRVDNVQNTLGAFEIQSTDTSALVPALKGMSEKFGFTCIAFAGMDGTGIKSDGSSFSVTELPQPETALSQGIVSYSETFESSDGRRVRLGQRPLYIDGVQVGALYVQIPLDSLSMSKQLNMFDGRGYFMLFEGSTGEIMVRPSEEAKTPIDSGMTLYSFLQEASSSASDGAMERVEEASSSSDAQNTTYQSSETLASLEDMVTAGQTGLTVGVIDGKPSYVCVAPVGLGNWYVCNVIPVENVRAESSIALTAFKIVFTIVTLCFFGVVALLFASYHKHMRERNVAMKSRLYKALSESLDMAVNLYCPLDGTVTPIVAKSARILGYSMPEIMSDRRIADKLSLSEDGTLLLERLRSDLIDKLAQGEFSFVHMQSGKTRWIAYAASPLVYEGRRRVLVVFRDVTKEKELQLSMKDAMMAAEAANQAKSEFLSRMSHEIRTPMNAIIGMLQIAKLHVGDAERTGENLKKIGTASNHLLNLINDVLDISKIESGKMALACEPFRLRALVEQVAEVIKLQCDQKDLSFEVSLPSDDEVFVGDIVRFRQLLINLLTNSVKYTPEGGHVGLAVSVRSDAITAYRCVTLTVTDDGIGMTEEYKERLFEPFVMEGRSKAEGTGLGMPIVKNIVTMMGGDIHVDTTVGEGTTFIVMINLRTAFDPERQALAESERVGEAWDRVLDASGWMNDGSSYGAGSPFDGALDDAAKRQAHPEEASSSASIALMLQGVRVLLVEDNDMNAEIACELLQEVGLVIDRAENGEVAVCMFNESSRGFYDIVLMDVQMPLMDGYEATRQIRALARPDARDVPIIAMSANAFAEDVRASLDSGMNAHLSKPIDMRKVLETIDLHVRKYRSSVALTQNSSESSSDDANEDGQQPTRR